jgi:hypothetical protein
MIRMLSSPRWRYRSRSGGKAGGQDSLHWVHGAQGDPSVHLRMFEVADKQKFHFDTVQMPINVMDAHFRSFLDGVAPVAQEHGTAILAMKTFGDPYILQSETVTPT